MFDNWRLTIIPASSRLAYKVAAKNVRPLAALWLNGTIFGFKVPGSNLA